MVSISNVWDRTTEFLGDNLRRIMPIAILAILVPATISASLTGVAETGSQGAQTGIALLGLVLSLLSLWGQLAIASLVVDGVGARRATQRFGPALGVYLLLLLVVAAAVMAVILPIMLVGGYDFSQMQMNAASMQSLQLPPGVGIWLFLVFLVLLIALIALVVRLAPLTAVIIAERRGVGAIARAFRLTRGLALKLFGVVILYAVVSIVAQWAATAVFGSVLELIAGGEGPLSLAKIVTSVISAAVQTVFTVLASVFMAKLYLACVAREEKAGASAMATAAPLS